MSLVMDSMRIFAMRRTIVGLAASLLLLAGCLHAPMPWSPDGSWIAYTVEVRPFDQILSPGWTFDTSPPPKKPATSPASSYRLWATRTSTNASVLLEESTGPITAPGWSPDGRALAFGRIVTDPDHSKRFEVVILEGLTRRRIVSSRPLTALDAEASRLPYQAIAWSPDGRYLAVPQLEPMGLSILRADNGRAVNTIPDAFLPSWSPTGGRLAFYLRSGGHSLHYVDSALGQPRHLVDVGQAGQAPGWTRDGLSIFVVARRSSPKVGEAGNEPMDLVRVRVDTLAVETIRTLSAEFGPNRDRPVEGTSITFDRDAENLLCATQVEGQPNQITWYHPRDNAVFKKFSVVDFAIPVGSLSLSPDGRTLALRVGTSEQLSSPVLCDLESSDLKSRLVAPDDSARLEWIATLTRLARTILADLPPASARLGIDQPTPIDRPTILPVLTEMPAKSENSNRLHRIGKLGRPLCDRPRTAPELDATTRKIFDEARLFFDYLREDYSEALKAVEALEADAETPERRTAVLTIRAQILLNQGQFTSARRIIAFLDQIDKPVARRVEWTGGSYRLTDDPRPDRGWPRYLAESSIRLQASLHESKSAEANASPPLLSNRADILFRAQQPLQIAPLVPPAGDDQPVNMRPNSPKGLRTKVVPAQPKR